MGLFRELLGGSRQDGEPHHVVEIEGFGPITIRSLSKKDMEAIKRETGDDVSRGVALMIQRGLVEPKFTELDPARLEAHDEVIDAIGTAIFDRSWANEDKPQRHGSLEVAFHPTPERRDYVGVSIVGESHYQDALGKICGRRGDEEVRLDNVAATLVPEPENPYDSNAVRVEIDGMQVGYLSRDIAPAYQRRVVRLLEEGGDPTVEAYIGAQGPEGENPNLGVRLHIPKDSPLSD